MKVLSYILFFLAGLMVLGPIPAYLYLVMPYAATTRDPDAIEVVAWFGGILSILVGAFLVPVALGVWLHARSRPKIV
ncbi:MAG TPA: hypothetical protein PKD26_14605 [Pyrinomonadaceae bacterium]|nr:hypothetical protein [Pyrinomonadaceae bacterium]